MNDEEMLNALVLKQHSAFALSDERLRRLFVLLLKKVRK